MESKNLIEYEYLRLQWVEQSERVKLAYNILNKQAIKRQIME